MHTWQQTCINANFQEITYTAKSLFCCLTLRSVGRQVTYRDQNKPDVVIPHGLTNGSSSLLADLPKEQFLSLVHLWYRDRVYGLYFRSSNGSFLPLVGAPAGTQQDFQKPIFGFYGGVKDGALVSLGFYTLAELRAARGRTRMVGGGNGNFTRWDDTSSLNGAACQLLLPSR